MVVAFTGYRPEKMPFVESKKDEAYLKFRKRQLQVIERLIERGCTHFISGVAMGFDTWVAEDILALQKNNSSLELECAIPFPGQADRWSTSDQKRRYKILTHASIMFSSDVTISIRELKFLFFLPHCPKTGLALSCPSALWT